MADEPAVQGVAHWPVKAAACAGECRRMVFHTGRPMTNSTMRRAETHLSTLVTPTNSPCEGHHTTNNTSKSRHGQANVTHPIDRQDANPTTINTIGNRAISFIASSIF